MNYEKIGERFVFSFLISLFLMLILGITGSNLEKQKTATGELFQNTKNLHFELAFATTDPEIALEHLYEVRKFLKIHPPQETSQNQEWLTVFEHVLGEIEHTDQFTSIRDDLHRLFLVRSELDYGHSQTHSVVFVLFLIDVAWTLISLLSGMYFLGKSEKQKEFL